MVIGKSMEPVNNGPVNKLTVKQSDRALTDR